MSAHTPGPWTVEGRGTTIKMGDRAYAGVDQNEGVPFAEAAANACLIAAAPELLEIVEEILRAGNVNTESARKLARNAYGVLERAREVTSRARGQGPVMAKARGTR